MLYLSEEAQAIEILSAKGLRFQPPTMIRRVGSRSIVQVRERSVRVLHERAEFPDILDQARIVNGLPPARRVHGVNYSPIDIAPPSPWM